MAALNMPSSTRAVAVPPNAGASLKPEHYRSILETEPSIGFFEVHAENYMGAGGPPLRYLQAIRERYPISLHGVGLSIGADRPLDSQHLERLKKLIERYEPGLFSEHLAWSTHDTGYLNDLLPLPYTEGALARVCEHIDRVHATLGRRMLLENPSTYVVFAESMIPEVEFLAEVAARTGCGLLLDVANVEVSATNHGYDPIAYLDAFPMQHVGEIHLAGSAETVDDAGNRLLIDAHDSPVAAGVWGLYSHVLDQVGPVPTLIEWDNGVPAWPVLFAEAERAEGMLLRAARQKTRQGGRDVAHPL
ncbi:MNIO family bufferin maturase [Ferrovibrio xuzhouensis]|uniref:UPF0276 protein ACFOOQ_16445 n=1 Tax=Ferrovibrio xuzhouensis TaxID=1576914 RepID=A0ABV7VI28_9PROT